MWLAYAVWSIFRSGMQYTLPSVLWCRGSEGIQLELFTEFHFRESSLTWRSLGEIGQLTGKRDVAVNFDQYRVCRQLFVSPDTVLLVAVDTAVLMC